MKVVRDFSTAPQLPLLALAILPLAGYGGYRALRGKGNLLLAKYRLKHGKKPWKESDEITVEKHVTKPKSKPKMKHKEKHRLKPTSKLKKKSRL